MSERSIVHGGGSEDRRSIDRRGERRKSWSNRARDLPTPPRPPAIASLKPLRVCICVCVCIYIRMFVCSRACIIPCVHRIASRSRAYCTIRDNSRWKYARLLQLAPASLASIFFSLCPYVSVYVCLYNVSRVHAFARYS